MLNLLINVYSIQISRIFEYNLKPTNMKNLTIEKRNKEVSNVKNSLNYIVNSAPTKQDAVNRMRDILSSEIKLGWGGSHIWASNQKNERLFIVTGY